MATAKAYKGLAMEGPIATWYAKNTARDESRFRDVAQRIAHRVPSGAHVLEVAPGPGYLAIELARRNLAVTALDISRSFVRIASENAANAGVAVDVRHGDAAHMPLADSSVDAIVCVAAFKNFADPIGALDEMYRVLKPGAQASIFDLRHEASLADVDAEVRHMRLSAFNAWMTRWTFRVLLLKRAYTAQQLSEMTAQSRFGCCEIERVGIGFEWRLTKPAPAR